MRTGRAFTLIELLVVIAVIALIIGILLPALAGARESARTTRCLANVRSIAQGLSAYSGDYREMFPHWSAWQVYGGDGSTNEDTPGLGWVEQLEDHLSGSPGVLEAFQCPARVIPAIRCAFFLQSRYTASLTQHRFYQSLRHAQVILTSAFVLTGDATNPYLFAEPYGSPHQVPNVDPDDAREPATLYAGEKGRQPHKGGSNLAFLDGHAATFREVEPAKMTWHGRAMKVWADVD